MACGHKITAADATKPVIPVEVSAGANDGDTGQGESDIQIDDLSVLHGSIGIPDPDDEAELERHRNAPEVHPVRHQRPQQRRRQPDGPTRATASRSRGTATRCVGANSIGTNSGDGINVTGNNNLLKTNNIQSNKGDGIDVTGKINTVIANKVGEKNLGNKGNGILVTCRPRRRTTPTPSTRTTCSATRSSASASRAI